MILASTCISTVIEIYGDKIRVSHGFDSRQKLWYIAGIAALDLRSEIDDITVFFGPQILPIRWRDTATNWEPEIVGFDR